MLERESELGVVLERLEAALPGAGCLVVVEGPAGIGKTAWLDAVMPVAASRGMRCLRACGGELEREFSFGLVRQLVEPVREAAGEAERTALLAGAAGLASVVDPRSPASPRLGGGSGRRPTSPPRTRGQRRDRTADRIAV